MKILDLTIHLSPRLPRLGSPRLEVMETVDLHPWFIEVLDDGTGLGVRLKDNDDWPKKGRPILEAFFHAKTMLGFAVKYRTELGFAPAMMPSGWAALRDLHCCEPKEGEKTNVAGLIERAIKKAGRPPELFRERKTPHRSEALKGNSFVTGVAA